jgi:hypothetical protein
MQNEFNPEAELNFTPYQAAQYGTSKHSASLPQSNPLMHKQAEESKAEPTLMTNQVKKVWGAEPTPAPKQEETKEAQQPSAEKPSPVP